MSTAGGGGVSKTSNGSSCSNKKMNSRVVTIEKCAYIKAVLHASKHFDSHTGGYFLGSEGTDGNVNISDALPLLHGYPSGPIFQIGENQAKAGGAMIVGYYFCNENDKDDAPYYIPALLSARPSLIVFKVDLNLLLTRTSICFSCLETNVSGSSSNSSNSGSSNSNNSSSGGSLTSKDVIELKTVEGDSATTLAQRISECIKANDHQMLYDVDELLTSSGNIEALKNRNQELSKTLQK